LNVTYTPDLDPATGRVRGFMVLGSDVTARKAAETALRRSEERWRGLFERMAEGFFIGEMIFQDGRPFDFRFLEVNPAFEVLTNLHDVSGKTCREAIPGIEQELMDRYGRVVETGQSDHFEIEVADLKSWFEVRARSSEKNQFVVLFLNITERKRIEAQFREAERRQEALVTLGDRLRDLQDVPSMIYAGMEIIGRTLACNRAGFAKIGANSTEVSVDRDWTDEKTASLGGNYHLDDFGAELRPSLERGEVISVSDVFTAPLTSHNVDSWLALQIRAFVNIPLMVAGKLAAILFVNTTEPRLWTDSDVTFIRKVADRTWAAAERMRALEELQQSEGFTRSVLASSPDCIKILDLAGNLLTVNEGGCHQMEIDDVASLIGKKWAEGWHQDSAKAWAAVSAAARGEASRFEGYYPTARGTPKWWEVAVTPIRNGAGEPIRILAVARDISDRRHAERERERLTAELRRSNEDLSQFAHTVAHDLQSPLRGVSGFAQLLRRNAASRLTPADGELLNHIVDSARHMAELVSALLRFAQLGHGEVATEPVEMDGVLDAALDGLRIQLEEGRVTIRRNHLPTVNGDFLQLVQLLQNLIGNAIKYSSPDRPPVVEISASSDPPSAVFRIEDNGEGIEEQFLQTIFEPLKRLHGSDIPGTGLGLAMCQRIVQRHGGRIWVESKVGSGSTFFFTLLSA
jgi:PAS domain S-box-containing protein